MYKRSMYVHTKNKHCTLSQENIRSPYYLRDTYSVFTHTGTGLRLQFTSDTTNQTYCMSKPIACKLSGGKAPRLSEVHCDRDSVCVKTDTRDLGYRFLYRVKVLWCKMYVIEGLVFTRNN